MTTTLPSFPGSPAAGRGTEKTRLLSFALGVLAATSATAAPTQWSGNGHWYEFVSNGLVFDQARAEAESRTFSGLKGHLVTITSEEENTFAHGVANGAAAWLGASDAAVDGQWRWVSGPEANQLVTYTKWGPHEPNGGTAENFAVYNNPWGGGDWNDRSDATIGYVVEYSAPIPEPETYGMLLAGLGVIGLGSRRMTKKR